MYIRQARKEDLPEIMQTIDYGRHLMRANGNMVQWMNGHPSQALIEADIAEGQSYVCVSDNNDPAFPAGQVLATFYLMEQPEPSYQVIDGQWLNDEPYVTIHRIASNGKLPGSGRFAVQWVIDHYPQVRIDTHETNRVMMNLLKRLGFVDCGEIILSDNTPRKAYHYERLKSNESQMIF